MYICSNTHTIMSGVYVFNFGLNNLNNGTLRGVKAMPLKDLNSDADSSFAADRRAYENILATDNTHPEQYNQKKWIGGSRDASDVAYRRRVAAAGASMNPSGGAFSFTSKTEKNTVINALNRCRNQGKCAPPKIAASPHHTGVPTPIYKTPVSLMPKNTVCNNPSVGTTAFLRNPYGLRPPGFRIPVCPPEPPKKPIHF